MNRTFAPFLATALVAATLGACAPASPTLTAVQGSKVDRSYVPRKGEACNCNEAREPSVTLVLLLFSLHILDHSVVLWKEVSVISV